MNILSETDSLLILKSVSPYSEHFAAIWRVYCTSQLRRVEPFFDLPCTYVCCIYPFGAAITTYYFLVQYTVFGSGTHRQHREQCVLFTLRVAKFTFSFLLHFLSSSPISSALPACATPPPPPKIHPDEVEKTWQFGSAGVIPRMQEVVCFTSDHSH